MKPTLWPWKNIIILSSDFIIQSSGHLKERGKKGDFLDCLFNLKIFFKIGFSVVLKCFCFSVQVVNSTQCVTARHCSHDQPGSDVNGLSF